MISVIVPGYNAEKTVNGCLEALLHQTTPAEDYELIFVDDGSTDRTAEIVGRCPALRLLRLPANRGAAAARNAGLQEARGDIILFTDADCAPEVNWIEMMRRPFQDAAIAGCKGVYRTRQRGLVPRFVQLEYESRYQIMERLRYIDFVDTYSAGYRRDILLRHGGFDERLRFVEDQELSFRLARSGCKLLFNPQAVVYHQHVATWDKYVRRKFGVGFWKAAVLRSYPGKALQDSHTPQSLKVELALAAATLLCAALAWLYPPLLWVAALAIVGFVLVSVPFIRYALQHDPAVGVAALPLLFTRALALGSGLIAGSLRVFVSRRE